MQTFALLAQRFEQALHSPFHPSQETWLDAVWDQLEAVATDAMDLINAHAREGRKGFVGSTSFWAVMRRLAATHPHEFSFPEAVASRNPVGLQANGPVEACRLLAKMAGERPARKVNRSHSRKPLSKAERIHATDAISLAVDALRKELPPERITRRDVQERARSIAGTSRGLDSRSVDTHPSWRTVRTAKRSAEEKTGTGFVQAVVANSPGRHEAGTERKSRSDAAIALMVREGISTREADQARKDLELLRLSDPLRHKQIVDAYCADD